MRRQALSSDVLGILLIVLSISIHIGWIYFTRYVEEDAFITFRYAKQIAAGNGFVYNAGEPLYGTTTPLFTLFLSLWLTFISADIILGANLLNVLAAAAIPFFTWKTLRFLNRSSAEQFFILIALLLSSKLIRWDANGMEISLTLSLLASSWYAWVKGSLKLTGLLCGLLLWTRIDNVFWVLVLVLVTLLSSRKNAFVLGTTAGIIYLPWIIFATSYFGSPIPYTVTAKWINYIQFNHSPLIPHLAIIFKYMSPFRDRDHMVLQWLGTLIVFGVACWGIWKNRLFQERAFCLLLIFEIFEISRLTFTRTTFFNWYFIPILWSILILFGMGLSALWDKLKAARTSAVVFLSFFLLWAATQIFIGISFAQSSRETQIYRHERSLKAMGLWLKENTAPQSIILLEPLGYVGYYSERAVIDEVGLVTPAVTALKLRHIGNEEYTSIFKPDYVIVHCDDQIRIPVSVKQSYHLVKTFNPLNFISATATPSNLAWGSCYQIWEKVDADL